MEVASTYFFVVSARDVASVFNSEVSKLAGCLQGMS